MSVWSVLAFFILMLTSACQSAAVENTPTVTIVPATTQALPGATLEPTPQALPIAGPQRGTTMLWLDGSTLIYLPAGEFVMGNGAADAPAHNVRLNAYWIQQSEVTNAMYAACVRAGTCRGVPGLNEAGREGHPVTGVTWAQARNYCDWIQGRLPTEAEWERAAQGPDGAAYPWGNEAPDCQRANFGNCRGSLAVVGSTLPGRSPLGLLDMAGNAAEWIGDWYNPHYYQTAPSDNPVGPPYSNVRVVRGGSYLSSAAQISAYARAYERPKNNRIDLGFRCVVPNPILYPPYCQTRAFVPITVSASEGQACQPPAMTIRGNYCQQKKGYVSVDVPAGTRWRVETPRFECISTSISAETDRLTCFGQGNLDFQVTLCTGNCFAQISASQVTCPTGYRLNAENGTCTYQRSPEGSCPDVFLRLEKDTQTFCVPGAIEQICPAGHYFDEGIKACLPGNGQLECLIYGLEAKQTATICYQGCPAGYTYASSAQCCQSNREGDTECPSGYGYDPTVHACVSGTAFSGEGCVTVTLHTGACVYGGVYLNCEPDYNADKSTQTCVMR